MITKKKGVMEKSLWGWGAEGEGGGPALVDGGADFCSIYNVPISLKGELIEFIHCLYNYNKKNKTPKLMFWNKVDFLKGFKLSKSAYVLHHTSFLQDFSSTVM